MSIITKVADFFRRPEGNEGDEQFRDAAETYRKVFEQTEPLTTRARETNEFSPLWLDAIELSRHQEAIRKLTSSLNSLRDSLSALSPANSTYESKCQLYSAACQMQRHAVIAYSKAATCTGLAAAKQKFNLMQKKFIAAHESPESERAVQMEIDTLARLSDAAALSQQEAVQLEEQLDFSLEFTKLLLKSSR
ncbi:hypothetical protein J2X04_000953 [Lysobacter niabensis]|uniref:Uncharacterized protein n=1 Tax=Agrilutibacter niabensis TaxID=380628 RepID=A0ABU1VMA1_9GAMM|nr:hypothetical protein [Lysobacter niabensis]MDR7098606.1 hypothetical protein [Lysobacter niabensis]